MKVLFAVSNEEISKSIVKNYQREYKDIISYKNVYYFNALIKEIKKDKTYDRIVISEDLEPFANNNYDVIDNFLFEKLDTISDEANEDDGREIDIILICTDRRKTGDSVLNRFFGLGIYSAIIGEDRSIENVCALINKPRTKKESKLYYKVDAEDVSYMAEDENTVTEVEIQNIKAHFTRLEKGNKSVDQFVESFENIVSQYNPTQLKLILRFLPLGARVILERNSSSYQRLTMNDGGSSNASNNRKEKRNNKDIKSNKSTDYKSNKASNTGINILDRKNVPTMTGPVVIPGVNNTGVRKIEKNTQKLEQEYIQPKQNNIKPKQDYVEPINLYDEIADTDLDEEFDIPQTTQPQSKKAQQYQEEKPVVSTQPINLYDEIVDTDLDEEFDVPARIEPQKVAQPVEVKPIMSAQPQPKKGRGRPRKIQPEIAETSIDATVNQMYNTVMEEVTTEPKKGRGRPRKIQPEVQQEVKVTPVEIEEVTDYQENRTPTKRVDTRPTPTKQPEIDNNLFGLDTEDYDENYEESYLDPIEEFGASSSSRSQEVDLFGLDENEIAEPTYKKNTERKARQEAPKKRETPKKQEEPSFLPGFDEEEYNAYDDEESVDLYNIPEQQVEVPPVRNTGNSQRTPFTGRSN